MAEQFMDYDLAASIVADIEARVGRVGGQPVLASQPGERFDLVELSRGGIVTPGHSREEQYEARRRTHVYKRGDQEGQLIYPGAAEPSLPVYRPDLAVVRHYVGTDDNDGIHRHTEIASLDDNESREYVFVQGDDQLWRAYDTFGNAGYDDVARTSEYFPDAARPIESDEEGLVIQGLIGAFDAALKRRAEDAVQAASGLIPQTIQDPRVYL